MQLKAGSRLKSSVCDTQIVVVKAPADDVDLTCGGAAMVPLDADVVASGTVDEAHSAGTLLGKRYADDDLGLELLCTKPGKGSLAVAGNDLPVKQPKALPSSD
jgi:hypothetical protein